MDPNIPDVKNDAEGGLLNKPALRLKFSALIQYNHLLSAMDKAVASVENTKHFSLDEKKAIIKFIKNERESIRDTKKDIEDENNFDQDMAKGYREKLSGHGFVVINLIPKKIDENQVEHARKIIERLKLLANKMEIYMEMAEKNGLDVAPSKNKLTKAGEKIVAAEKELDKVRDILSGINQNTNMHRARREFDNIDVELKSIYKNIAEAKILMKQSSKELKEVVQK